MDESKNLASVVDEEVSKLDAALRERHLSPDDDTDPGRTPSGHYRTARAYGRRDNGSLWKPVIIGVSVALASGAAGWAGKAAWGGMTAAITADSATKLDLGKVADGLQAIVETNAIEHGDIKKRMKADGKVLRAVARKLRIETQEPKDEP